MIGAGRRCVVGALCAWVVVACKPSGEAAVETAEAVAVATPSDPDTPSPDSEAAPSPTLASAAADPLPAAEPEPAVAAAREGEAPEPVEPEPALPETPYGVLILGDSLAATGIGALLEKKLDAHPHIQAYRKGKSSSGLARPDFFDWMAEGKRQVDLRDPKLVVVIIGGNDGQDLTRLRSSDGPRVAWKDEAWADAYRDRVDTFLATVGGEDRTVLWIGLPTMGLSSLERKLVLIRGIQQAAVEALGDRGIYLDTSPFVAAEDGSMLTDAPVGAGKKSQKIRAEDEIHFTMAGSEYFADHVYPEVLHALALPDVEPTDG